MTLKSLRQRLNERSKLEGFRLDTVQQDYLLTWLLYGIGQSEVFRDSLVFKGGTALKKCYFGRYRFSEDLDFTAKDTAPMGTDLASVMKEVCRQTESKMGFYSPIKLYCERYLERQPHPQGQEAFIVRAQFPWQREPLTKVMIEISKEEMLLFPSVYKPIIHDYSDLIDGSIQTYHLNEVVLEKLRAILQHTRKLHERDWSRSRARDYYDLWHILCHNSHLVDLKQTTQFLKKKCVGKGVEFSTIDDFFQPVMLANVKQTWNQWLGRLVKELPPVDQVLQELRPAVEAVLRT